MRTILSILFFFTVIPVIAQYPLVNGYLQSPPPPTNCTAPTFIQSAEVPWGTATSPKTTSSFAVQTNDVLVAIAAIPDNNLGAVSVSGGGLVWTVQQNVTDNGYAGIWIWTAVASSNTSITVTFTQSAPASLYGGNVLTFRGSSGVGALGQVTNVSGAPSLNVTTLSDNSAVVFINSDWIPVDGASRTYRTATVSASEVSYFTDPSNYTIYGAYYSNVGTKGMKTVGLLTPNNQKYAIAAVEIKGTGSGCTGGSESPGDDLVRDNVIFTSLFDDATPFSEWNEQQSCCEVNVPCCSYAVTQSTTIKYAGAGSFHAEVRATDPEVHSGFRAELQGGNPTDQGNMWYGMAMYVEQSGGGNWNPRPAGHILQWHPNNGSGSASLAIWGSEGYFDITLNSTGSGSVCHQINGSCNGGGNGTNQFGAGTRKPIVTNVWHIVVFNVNWSNSGSGVVKVWIDGQLHFWQTGMSWNPSTYLKVGINRFLMEAGAPWIVYYDELRIGGPNATYNDVSPLQILPEPN